MQRGQGSERLIPVIRWLSISLLIVSFLPGPRPTVAAEMAKPVRIGVLTASWGPTPGVVGLAEGLVALGYRENEDFVIGVRFTEGDISDLPDVARQMVERGVDVLFAVGQTETKAVRQATRTHPIVFQGAADPVGEGLIESFARPGGNVTGVTDLDLTVSGKRLQMFKQMIPGLKRVLFPYNERNPYQAGSAKHYREAAQRLGLVLVELKLATMDEAGAALAGVRKDEIDGILAPRDVDLNIPGFVLEATKNLKIPSMFDNTFYLKDGGLASYGHSFLASGRQLARLVDKIIRGADPGEIPVEIDQSLEFVINMDVAIKLGIEIPPEMLFQADRLMRTMVE